MHEHIVFFFRAIFAFHTVICTLLYLYYTNRLPFNSNFLLNFLHFTLLNLLCISKLFSTGSQSIQTVSLDKCC